MAWTGTGDTLLDDTFDEAGSDVVGLSNHTTLPIDQGAAGYNTHEN